MEFDGAEFVGVEDEAHFGGRGNAVGSGDIECGRGEGAPRWVEREDAVRRCQNFSVGLFERIGDGVGVFIRCHDVEDEFIRHAGIDGLVWLDIVGFVARFVEQPGKEDAGRAVWACDEDSDSRIFLA